MIDENLKTIQAFMKLKALSAEYLDELKDSGQKFDAERTANAYMEGYLRAMLDSMDSRTVLAMHEPLRDAIIKELSANKGA